MSCDPYATPAELPADNKPRTWLYYLPEIVWCSTAILALFAACHFYVGLREAENRAARAIQTLKARDERFENLERYYSRQTTQRTKP